MFLYSLECRLSEVGSVQLIDLKGRLQRQLARMLVIYLLMILEAMTGLNYNLVGVQQLIQMIDNFECEKVVIKQYIKLHLEKVLQQASEFEITRLPFQIYRYCKDIFKRERMVSDYLYTIFQEIFYLIDLQQLKQEKADELSNLYMKLLTKYASNKAIFISQINLRCILLALSVKLDKNNIAIFKKKFKDYIKQLQLELIINTELILSDVIIKELDYMRNQFDDLEYYQHLSKMFQRLEIDKVVQWIQKVLETKRQKFQQKQQSNMPFKVGQKQIQGNSTKMISASTHLKQATKKIKHEGNGYKNGSYQGQSTVKSKTSEKDTNIIEPGKNQRGSCIRLANKLRKSLPGSTGRYSCKYTFKSTKKNQTQQVVYENEDQAQSPTLYEDIQNYPTKIHPSTPVKNNQPEDENSKFLCAATPPRRNISKMDQR